MRDPIATYRLQFHRNFTFSDFEAIIPYLVKLGISTVYASPIFAAVPGTTHGYDVTDPLRINPELGTEEQLYEISRKLKYHHIGWLQDIVPNHMAFHPKNQWLNDVLEKGRCSDYAPFFDIYWDSPVYEGRLMVPFIDGSLENVISRENLKVGYDGQRLVLQYFDSTYPLSPKSYSMVMDQQKDLNLWTKSFLSGLARLQETKDNEAFDRLWNRLSSELMERMEDPPFKERIDRRLQEVNQSPEILHQIANEQEYALCDWRETDQRINYKRFFTVNSLICLKMDSHQVFMHYHQLIHKLVCTGVFQGLRVDHVDGLLDPAKYVTRLRQLVGEEAYIVVEKILQRNELLPEHWPVQGTTGYDFLGISNGLFANSESEKRFTDLYSLVGKASSTERQIREKKASILYQSMNGEYENLTNLFYELDLHSAGTGATVDAVKKVISEFLIRCPVYRFYGNDFPVATEEAIAIQEVLDGIGTSKHLRPAVALLKDHLLIKPHDGNAEYNGRVRYFYQRLMQLAGPLMAKGVEDTFMYTYNRLLARNEVGDSPETFGHTTQQFHQKMIERQAHWPLSLNATSTHDTKRGEDVRARLNVLTDLAQDWSVNIGSWQTMNSAIRQKNAPDPNDEYSIYQLLIGHYSEEFDNAEFKERVLQYLEKALREAKVHSNWTDPGEHYENATKGFAMKLIDDRQGFRKSFCRLYGKVVDQSCLNSLAQVLLKFTCPGIPDVYQGCELFDLSFVDPDNRRAVDFQKRADWLNEIHRQQDEKRFIEGLWHNRQNEKVKLWLTNKLFQLRKKYNEVFAGGHYIPLQVRGKYKKNFLAYARRYRSHWIVAGVPLHLAAMAPKNATEEIWEDTRIVLPEEAPARWGNLFTYPETGSGREIYLREVLTGFPLLLLDLQSNQTDRGAGILLAVSSLPAPFGIGDFGPEAYAFADFLSRSKQKFWQILPLNPLEKEQGYSPYSSVSSMAGNTLLISPELMVADGLIDEGWCNARRVASKGNIDYENAEQIKRVLFQAGWERFKQGSFEQLEYAFTSFCRSEGRWLDDFALYRVLKRFNSNKPWYQWPKRFRLREPAGLHKFKASHSEAIELEKWLQFLFARQWMALKTYCNELNISIVGDLPFYVSYDSADVWTHQEIFALDKNGKILTQAGVPPDYFNSDGQLWGMPVFRWDILKDQKYDWWVRRIRKNIDFYDLLRLDHFRAFAFYWAVPGNADNARGGEWKAGPGADFFRNLEQQIGILPFLAEDLGSIDLPVYRLRDEFKLPGMKVLQFAFGNDAGESLNAPHHYTTNHFVYTGTHDNNTTLGWYLNDAGEHDIANIANYTGLRVNAKSIVSIFMRLAYASVAKVAILPMQDILRLDDTARMNTPASSNDNWLWQLMPGQIQPSMEKELRKWITIFSR